MYTSGMIPLLLAKETYLKPTDLEGKLTFHLFVLKIFVPYSLVQLIIFFNQAGILPLFVFTLSNGLDKEVTISVGLPTSP